jgi:hypothetical protein
MADLRNSGLGQHLNRHSQTGVPACPPTPFSTAMITPPVR